MKKLLLIMMMLPMIVQGQETLYYEGVIEAKGVSKEKLYVAARRWFSDNFENMDAVLDINDKETGELSGRFKIPYHSKINKGSDCSKGYINSRLSLYFKDGRVKYKLGEFVHDPHPNWSNCSISYNFGTITDGEAPPRIKRGWGQKWSVEVWNEMQEIVKNKANYVTTSLAEYLKQGNSQEEW